MPAVAAKNYALQLAAASDLGFGGQLAEEADGIANELKKKKQPSIVDQLTAGGPFMGWGGAGTRGMAGAAAMDLGITPF